MTLIKGVLMLFSFVSAQMDIDAVKDKESATVFHSFFLGITIFQSSVRKVEAGNPSALKRLSSCFFILGSIILFS